MLALFLFGLGRLGVEVCFCAHPTESGACLLESGSILNFLNSSQRRSSAVSLGTLIREQFVLFLLVGFDQLKGFIIFLGGYIAFLENSFHFFVYGIVALLNSQVEGIFEHVPAVVLDEVLKRTVQVALGIFSTLEAPNLAEEGLSGWNIVLVHLILIQQALLGKLQVTLVDVHVRMVLSLQCCYLTPITVAFGYASSRGVSFRHGMYYIPSWGLSATA